MAKQELTELYTPYPDAGGKLKRRGPVVPVRRGEQTRWLQDGRYIATWLVWLRRRRGLLLALLALAALGYGLARWLLLARSDGDGA